MPFVKLGGNFLRKDTFDHLKKYIHLLEIDYINGKIRNKKVHLSGNGYYHLSLKGRKITVHSIIAFVKFGERIIGYQVNHINGIKTDNRPENLEVVTSSENAKHAFKLGLSNPGGVYGEKHGQAKLTVKDVREIRLLLKRGKTQSEIAKMYGVSRSAIKQIKNGVNWRKVD